jgi:hypothetical protein
MRWRTLDGIVRSCLLQSEKTIHWYLPYLKAGSDCLRELTFDTLEVINTIRLQLNSYKAVGLPCDFVDWVKVGIPQGQFVQPLLQREGINRLNNFDDNGRKTTYNLPDPDNQDVLDANMINVNGLWIENHFNDKGENVGRYFGIGAGSEPDTFKVLRERSEIQFNEALGQEDDPIILEYISDGQTSNAATKIHPYAQRTIETYIFWKNSPNANNEKSPEAMQYHEAHRILRGRLSDITGDDLIRIIRRGYSGSIRT